MTEDELAEFSGNQINGERLQKNNKDSAKYHTKWLNMMYIRLLIARVLLKDNGVVFISIDDNEYANLIKLCNTIFNENNYLGTVVWKNVTDNNPTQIAVEHEYIICYAKIKLPLNLFGSLKFPHIKIL